MQYVIQYNGETDTFLMDGYSENFIGSHLLQIMKDHKILDDACSETHALHILRGNGIEVEILDEDGSLLDY